jgi:hypothetical protein
MFLKYGKLGQMFTQKFILCAKIILLKKKHTKTHPRTTLIIFYISIIHIDKGFFYTMKILHILEISIVSF